MIESKTVLVRLYDVKIHQKKLGRVFLRLKADGKEKSRVRKFQMRVLGCRNASFEKNAVLLNQGTKQCVQSILGHCWQWETNGHVCGRRQLQCPPRVIKTRANVTPWGPCSEFLPAAQCAKIIENPKSQTEQVPVV